MKVKEIDVEIDINDDEKLRKNLKEIELDEESCVVISAVSEGSKLLESCSNKSVFLSKICMMLAIYFGFIQLIIFFIWNNPEDTRNTFVHQRLSEAYKIYLGASIVLKLLFSILGFALKKLALVFYVVDLYLTYMWVLGLYYVLDGYGGTEQSRDEFVMYMITFFYVEIAFFLSSLHRSKKKSYVPVLGFALTQITAGIALYYADQNTQMELIQSSIARIFVFFIFVNLYQVLNASFIVNVRSIEFKENEYVLAYFQFYGDWINKFWIDFIFTRQQFRQKKQKALKEEKQKQDANIKRKTIQKLNLAIDLKKLEKQKKKNTKKK